MREEAAEVHEEVQAEVQAGRQEEEEAVREDLLRARLLAYGFAAKPQDPDIAHTARPSRSCA
jgi:hypothetical protein